jgi:hypothetical protein
LVNGTSEGDKIGDGILQTAALHSGKWQQRLYFITLSQTAMSALALCRLKMGLDVNKKCGLFNIL